MSDHEQQYLHELATLRRELDAFNSRMSTEMLHMRNNFNDRINGIRRRLKDAVEAQGHNDSSASNHHTPVHGTPPPRRSHDDDSGIHGTPTPAIPRYDPTAPAGPAYDVVPLDKILAAMVDGTDLPVLTFAGISSSRKAATPSTSQNGPFWTEPEGAPVDALSVLGDRAPVPTKTAVLARRDSGRPVVEPRSAKDELAALGFDIDDPCEVLIEFKRRRVMRFSAQSFITPGTYVVVNGDRGEDVGVVVYTWVEVAGGIMHGMYLPGAELPRSIGIGSGFVTRRATEVELQQLKDLYPELERRIVEIANMKVLEHSAPMMIVDAEYQFDKRKITLFYEAQQKVDFRDMVRDLFKTFRARIWMESVETLPVVG